jgi:hypothetical protein
MKYLMSLLASCRRANKTLPANNQLPGSDLLPFGVQ